MRTLTKSGKTVEEAVLIGLQELEVKREDVEIEILNESSKGLFGIFGNKEARVIIKVVNDPEEKAREFLSKLLKNFKLEGEVIAKRKDEILYVNILGENSREMGVLIGKRGKTLDAVQYLLSLVVNSKRDKFLKVILDTEGYRAKRESVLKELARKMAEKAVKRGKSVRLDPMNPYERRIIHSALQQDGRVETYSVGDEPYRRIVIQVRA
jgi:spoIIIJ-associated protein